MKKGWIVCLCVLLGACTFKKQQIKGVVIDITMDTVTVGVDRDTLLFCIQDANRENAKGILINDTLEVTYLGNYKKGMSAARLVLHPQQKNIVGGDRDEHGCIGSAGYVWSEVQKDCIRLFEKGVRTEAIDGSDSSVFIVFSPDSMHVELFFTDNRSNEILDRRSLSTGGYTWNIEDDDTKNVRLLKGQWTISQRGKLIYKEK